MFYKPFDLYLLTASLVLKDERSGWT